MKKRLSLFLGTLFGSFFVVHATNAVCTLNGEVVPCDQMPRWPFVMMLFFFLFMMFLLAFWVWMIVDVARNEKDNDLAIWILVVILLGFIGAIVYYFARKRPRTKAQKQQTPQTENTEKKGNDK